MSFWDAYRDRRRATSIPESVETLEHMQSYFQDGANWTRDMYRNASGARCLVAAANHVRVSSIDDAKHWLRQAIAEVAPGTRRIEDFNDSARTFDEVAAVIERAKQLALAAQRPAPVVEVLPPGDARPVVLNNSSPRPHVRRASLADWIMD